MPRKTTSPLNQKRIAILVPLVALCLSLFIVYPAWGRYQNLLAEKRKKTAELAKLKATPVPEPGPVRPAVNDDPSELPQFLGHLSTLAVAVNCHIVGFEALPPKDKEEESDGIVRPLKARLEFDEPYACIRDFLAQLARADRLYVVTELDIAFTPNRLPVAGPGSPLHAMITVERYVVPPDASDASAPSVQNAGVARERERLP